MLTVDPTRSTPRQMRSGARKSLATRAVSEVKVPGQDLDLRATAGQQNLGGRSRHAASCPFVLSDARSMTLVDRRRSRGRRTAEQIAVEIGLDWHPPSARDWSPGDRLHARVIRCASAVLNAASALPRTESQVSALGSV